MDIQRPLFQSIACALAGVLFLNPIIATAAQVTLDASGGNTQLGSAANGVPVINIATPNGNGLSHNKFTDYNVGQQGLILNNATGALQNTQLGGHIIGNANLGGRAAGIILNEVTGGSPSHLKGYTEVAGQSAHVVVANPYGIACDGCGFINTPRVTLSTGKPIVENGRLDRYDVDGGTIEIYGRGLNAANINQFELITRSARLNAELHAQRLAAVAGRNEVDADSLQATAKTADGSSKPLLAIDSSALGGMYVGAIRLIGTEHGVGVRLATDMAASSADIDIDVNGGITLKRTVAKGDIRLKGQEIVLAEAVQAGGSAVVVARDSLEVGKSLAAVNDLRVEAGLVDNRKAELVAGKSATIKAAIVDNRGGKVIGREVLAVEGGSLDNREGGLGGKVVTTQLSGKLKNDKGLIEAGESLSLSAGSLSNTEGKVRSLGSAGKSELKVAGHLDNDRGLIEIGNQRAEVQAKRLSNSGTVNASGDLTITASELSNRGTLAAGRKLEIDTPTLKNEGGLIFSATDIRLTGDQLTNLKGDIYSGADLQVTAKSLRNLSGTLESVGAMKIQALTLENARHTLDISTRKIAARLIYNGCYDCGGDKKNANFILEEIDRTEASNISARAALLAGGDMTLSGGAIENRHSLIGAGGDLRIAAESFSNQGAQIGDIYTQRFLSSHRTRSIGRVHNDANAFNAQNWPQAGSNVLGQINQFINAHISKSHRLGEPVFTPLADAAFDAVVQAGGKVQIDAKVIEQGVLRPGFDFVSGGENVATRVTINPQLRPDTSQRAIDPTTLPGFQLPEGTQGLFKISGNKQHPFLIETDPRFTALKQFLGSDYLLSRIGLTPDLIQRRLGDGFYEQRLVREALLARTGLRFIAGLNSDEAVFRHLMDNAIASKDALQLRPGVALSAEQVAALTHDIVWMQEQQIQGESVWVPVLYLAQVGNRLAPNGALIQGQELALISGSDLSNHGTLRAAQSLQLTANQIDNSGLLEAGGRLSLLARESIRNAHGGIIKGEDIVATAVTGDLINQRSITTHQTTRDRNDFADPAARIEAGKRLELTAGRDLHNSGSHLQAGGDAQLKAGRDLLIVSSQTLDSQQQQTRKSRWSQSQTTQLGSDVQVGGNLTATAGRDLAIVASNIKAEGDIGLQAKGDITIASAANESHDDTYKKSGGRKLVLQDSQVRQQSSVIEAGGNLKVESGANLLVSSSQLKAGGEAYLYAEKQLALVAAQDSDYHLLDKKNKGGWGSKETRRDEVTDIRHIGSSITSGSHLRLVSKGDHLYQKAHLESANDLTLDSGGAITFEAVKDLHQKSHESSKSDLSWVSMKGKGSTDETLRQSVLIAKGQTTIKAVDGLKIDLKQIDQHSIGQTIDAMVAQDPQLAWLKDAEQRGDVDWRRVQEIHDSFKYSHSSLGQGAMLAIIIIVTALTAGAASTLAGAMAGATAGSGTAMAAVGVSTVGATAGTVVAAGWGNVMVSAALTSLASTGAVSLINNKGDLGATVKDVTSSDNLKGYVVGGLTAGLTTGVLDTTFGVTGDNVNHITKGFDLASIAELSQFGAYLGAQSTVQAATKTAVQGGSFTENLQSALTAQGQHLLQAGLFNWVGDVSKKHEWADGSVEKVAFHALIGGLISQATGSDFATGAAAAGANEALIGQLSQVIQANNNLELMSAQLIGLLGAIAVSGDLDKGAQIAKNATAYNRQLHPDEKQLAQLLAKRSDGRYTAEQIEDQLRLSEIKGTGIGPATDIVASRNEIYDQGGKWVALGDSGKFVQVFAKADLDIISYIQQSTQRYAWTALPPAPGYEPNQITVTQEKRDRLSGRVLDERGGYRSALVVDGHTFTPRFLPCANAECIAAGANIDTRDPETLRWIEAANAKGVEDALLLGSVAPLPTSIFGKILARITGAKAVNDVRAGAGGNWNILDEIANPNIVKQSTSTACGAACAEMLLRDRGVWISQIELGTELTSMNSLARKLNKFDSGWAGNSVDTSSFNALNKTGTWSAMMWDSGSRIGHWIVVNGLDDAGRVLIKDPFHGTQYKMKLETFKETWNGHAVYKQ